MTTKPTDTYNTAPATGPLALVSSEVLGHAGGRRGRTMDDLQYKILSSHDGPGLERMVAELIAQGWTPLGGLAVMVGSSDEWDYPFTFCQAMTITAESRNAALLVGR
jgi:hypothetical protein